MLEAKNISKTFEHPIKVELLKNISFQIKPEESVAIMGTSGAGKSTLLHILGSLEKPDSGELFLDGKPLRDLSKMRNLDIGFIFQSFFLMEHLTVLQNVLMPAKIARLSVRPSSQAYQRALMLLKKVGLYDRRNQLTSTLSGGEKQRTCIARALINNPSIIFADEPTGNLDQNTSLAIQKLLLDTIREEKKSLVVVTHDPEFAQNCDKVFFLHNGTLNTH